MREIITYIGSFVIGQAIWLMILQTFWGVRDTALEHTFTLGVQEQMQVTADQLERQFRLIGYGTQDSTVIFQASDTAITFEGVMDILDSTGRVDTMAYSLAPPVDPSLPNSRTLYCAVNGGPQYALATNLYRFSMVYYDQTGALTSVPSQIKSLTFLMTFQSDQKTGDDFAQICWERTIKPKNLR